MVSLHFRIQSRDVISSTATAIESKRSINKSEPNDQTIFAISIAKRFMISIRIDMKS